MRLAKTRWARVNIIGWVKTMSLSSRRVILVLCGALFLPALAVLVLQAFYAYESEANSARDRAIGAAEDLILLADARAQSDLDALKILSRSRFFTDGNLADAARRSRETVEIVSGWKAVVLSNRASGDTLFAVAAPGKEENGLRIVIDPNIETGSAGGVFRQGAYCPCVQVSVTIPGRDDLVLTAFVDPLVYQRMLIAKLPEGAVAGIVDRDGEFLARSLDFAERVGTQATSFVLDAVARGGRGVYEGRTYEGLVNYTAYETSDLTGWSGHIAIDNALLDRPMQMASYVVAGGAILSIAIAGSLLLYSLRDLALRRKEEARLLDLQRAEAVSQFTSGVVHDFRNVIATVVSGLKIIKRKSTDEDALSLISMMEASIARGIRLANQMLSYSRRGGAEVEAVDLAAVLDDMDYMIAQAAGRYVEVEIEKPDRGPFAMVNRDQLELAILNLVINAKEAMEGRGRLTINIIERSDAVELSVSDTGPGVPEDKRKDIFDAFHTTKPTGTGLGLAQVAGTASEAGGRVRVTGAEGGGACFVITLPIARDVTALNAKSA